MDKAINVIKCDKRPTMKLYRYFRNIDYAVDEIITGEIYLPLANAFNDPFDCRIINDGTILQANVIADKSVVMSIANKILLNCKDFIIDFFAKYDFDAMETSFLESVNEKEEICLIDYIKFIHHYSMRNDTIDDFMNLLKISYITTQPLVEIPKRVACFSEKNDSILMWAYYADKHSGVCLEYTPMELDFSVAENIKLFNGLQKVYYSENQYNNRKYLRNGSDINNMFFNKALCWAHEQEWRLVIEENIERIKFPCLTGIYLGVNFRDKHANLTSDCNFIKVIRAALKLQNKVPVYEAKTNNEKYAIDFTEIILRDRY